MTRDSRRLDAANDQMLATIWRNTMMATNTAMNAVSSATGPNRSGGSTRRTRPSTGSVTALCRSTPVGELSGSRWAGQPDGEVDHDSGDQ